MKVQFFAACDTSSCFREHSTLFKASLVTFRTGKVGAQLSAVKDATHVSFGKAGFLVSVEKHDV